MVARSASHLGGYSPVEPSRISVAADGTLAAVHESTRVTMLEVAVGAAFAEIGVDPDAKGSDVAWVCVPPRLLVLSRYDGHSTVHLLDPHGPRSLADIRLEAPMRLYATVGSAALLVSPLGAGVLLTTESHLMLYPIPTRTVPITAGAAGGQFMVAVGGAIEEWDPQSRQPKRRLRLPRSAAITAVGGSERLVWITTQQEPARIDVIPLINRGQPRAHDLPEPIAQITGHPRSDLVACVGAETGQVYAIDLDGRSPTRVIAPEGMDRIESIALVVGRRASVLAAQAGRPIALVPLDGREADVAPPAALAPDARSPDAPSPPSPDASDIAYDAPSDLDAPDDLGAPTSSGRAPAISVSPPVYPSVPASPQALHVAPATARFAGASVPIDALFRPPATPELGRRAPPPASSHAAVEPFPPGQGARHDPSGRDAAPSPGRPARSWRDEVVQWSRAVASPADRGPPGAAAIDALVARFDLAPELQPVLVLLYGAHLCGEPGVAPVAVARLLDGDWDEALGRGDLALHGIARYAGSRVALAPAIVRVLDELPPTTGALLGEPGAVALLGPCVVVAGDDPLALVAERYLAHVGGAILVAHDEADLAELLFEARALGAAPMLRATATGDPPDVPAIFAVADDAAADRLGIPRLA